MVIVNLPDGTRHELPASDLTVEEVRRAFAPLGYSNLGTAPATRTEDEDGNVTITFSRPVGGEKG